MAAYIKIEPVDDETYPPPESGSTMPVLAGTDDMDMDDLYTVNPHGPSTNPDPSGPDGELLGTSSSQSQLNHVALGIASPLPADESGQEDMTDFQRDPDFALAVYGTAENPIAADLLPDAMGHTSGDAQIKSEPAEGTPIIKTEPDDENGYAPGVLGGCHPPNSSMAGGWDDADGGKNAPIDVEEAERMRAIAAGFSLPGLLPQNLTLQIAPSHRQQRAAEPTTIEATQSQHSSIQAPSPELRGARDSDAGDLFLPEASADASERAHKKNGEPFGTSCFRFPFAAHPHHHKLRCGHTIQTRMISPCGKNCQRIPGNAEPIEERPFACTQGACNATTTPIRRRSSIFIEKRKPAPRSSIPGYVYGDDPVADEQRRAEKELLTIDALGGMGVSDSPAPRGRSSLQDRIRRRSRSPNRYEKPTYRERDTLRARSPPEARKASIPFVRAVREEVHRLVDEKEKQSSVGPECLLSRSIRNLKGLDASSSRQSDRVAHVEGTPGDDTSCGLVPSSKLATHGFPHSYASGGILHGKKVASVRNELAGQDTISEHQLAELRAAENGVVMEEEYQGPGSVPHEFLRGTFDPENTDDGADEEEDLNLPTEYDEKETFCHCESVADGYMLECVRCNKHFHPGCVGKGAFTPAQYDGDEGSECRQRDVQDVQQQEGFGAEFTCDGCDDLARSRAAASQGTTVQRLRQDARKQKAVRKGASRDDRASKYQAQVYQMTETLDGLMQAKKPAAKYKTTRKPTRPSWAPTIPKGTIWQRIVCAPEKIDAAYRISLAETAETTCAACNKNMTGVFYHCLQCPQDEKNSYDVCDTCVHNGASHRRRKTDHQFDIRHGNGNIPGFDDVELTGPSDRPASAVQNVVAQRDLESDRSAGASSMRTATAVVKGQDTGDAPPPSLKRTTAKATNVKASAKTTATVPAVRKWVRTQPDEDSVMSGAENHGRGTRPASRLSKRQRTNNESISEHTTGTGGNADMEMGG